MAQDKLVDYRFSGPDFSSPEAFVKSFCADHAAWHDATMVVYKPMAGKRWRDLTDEEKAARDRLDEEATAGYQQCLAPFLAAGVRLQGVVYDTGGAFFAPERTSIAGTSPVDGGYEVSFSTTDARSEGRYGSDFVAEIEAGAAGDLRLRQVWLIDGDERLPCL